MGDEKACNAAYVAVLQKKTSAQPPMESLRDPSPQYLCDRPRDQQYIGLPAAEIIFTGRAHLESRLLKMRRYQYEFSQMFCGSTPNHTVDAPRPPSRLGSGIPSSGVPPLSLQPHSRGVHDGVAAPMYGRKQATLW